MASKSLGTLTLDLVAKIGGYVGPMDEAARKTKKKSEEISSSLNGVKLAAAALGGGMVAGFTVIAKSQIDLADSMSKQSKVIGTSVEWLSELKHGASLAGVEYESLSGSLVKFNKNIASAFEGTGPAADAFADLGISVTDANGKLKTTDALFAEVADSFAVLEDGAVKTAIAQDLLGKSGAAMIPLLNGGSQALRESAEEAKRLGLVLDSEAAAKAEVFNDNLYKLKMSVAGLAGTVGMEAVDAMADFTSAINDPSVQAGIANFAKVLISVAEGAIKAASAIGDFTHSLKVSAFGFDPKNIADVEKQIELINSAIESPTERVRFFDKNGFIPWVLGYESEEELKSKLAMLTEIKKQLTETTSLSVDKADSGPSLQITSEQIEANRKLRLAIEERQKAAEKAAEAQRKIAEQAAMDFDRMRKDLQREIDLWGNKSQAIALAYDLERGLIQGLDPLRQQELVALAKKVDLLHQQEEAAEAASRMMESELDDLGGFDPQVFDDLKQEVGGYTKFAEDAAERINGAFSDAWMNIGTGFEGLRDGVVDGFKRMLAEMAHEALTKPIVMQIQQAVTGGAGQAGAGAAGQALGAIGTGGIYAAAAMVAVAAVGEWNKKQDEKFKTLTAEYRQATQSMGTVLGDSNKKSESIANGIAALESIALDSLGVNNQMLMALVDIRAGIAGVSAGLARSITMGGSLDFSNIKTGTSTFNYGLGAVGESKMLGGFIDPGQLFGSAGQEFISMAMGFMEGLGESISKAVYSKKKKIIDSGIKFSGQALADILAEGSVEAMAYATVQTKKKVLGVTTSNRVKDQFNELDSILLDQFSDVFASSAEALKLASGVFGLEFDKYIDALVIDPQKLSLKGLEGDALIAEIEAFFSSTLDKWTETLADSADSALSRSLFGFNVAGGKGGPLEVYSGFADALEEFQRIGEGAFETMIRLAGETQAFVEVADKLDFTLEAAGLSAVKSVQYLAEASGGFDQLAASVNNYASKFMSEAEQIQFAREVAEEGFAGLGIALPQSRDEFKNLVRGLDLTTEAGQKTFASLMGLVDATDMYLDAAEKQRQQLIDAVGSAFGSLTAAVSSERDALQKANDAAMSAIESSLSRHTQLASTLRSTLDSMSIASLQNDATTRRAAQAQIIAATAVAKAGGPLPTAESLQQALSVLASDGAGLFSTYEDYARDFYATRRSIAELEAVTGGQVDIDQKMLDDQKAYYDAENARFDALIDYYQQQLDAIKGVNGSVLSVAQAVLGLNQAFASAGYQVDAPVAALTPTLAPLAQDVVTTPQIAYQQTSFADLLEEVRTLRNELADSQFSIAKNTLKTADTLERWERGGLPPEREEL